MVGIGSSWPTRPSQVISHPKGGCRAADTRPGSVGSKTGSLRHRSPHQLDRCAPLGAVITATAVGWQ
ncbi:MAG: hypothetical protein CMM00_12715 [Rhodopirellula sp.]|nr:hypothetical protein [Rhodopirellula sp.]